MSILTSGRLRHPSAPTTPPRLLRLLTLGGVFLVGCGGDTGTDPDPDPPEQTTTSRLTVRIQPGSMGADAPFPVQPVIEIQDTIGNRLTNDNSTLVTATIASGSGTLQGQTSVTASGGVISYLNLGISGDPANYRLAFTAEGFVPDTSVAFSLYSGSVDSLTIGVEGSSMVLENGASLVVPRDAVDGEIMVTFRDTTGVTPFYNGLSDGGYVLNLSILRTDTRFSSTDSVRLAIPIDETRLSGGTQYIRAEFSNLPGESFVARAVLRGSDTLSIALPASGLAELNTDVLGDQVLLYPEEVDTAAQGTSVGGPIAGESVGSPLGWLDDVECNEHPLRRSPSSKVPAPGLDVAIVLVHGWDPDIANCDSFEDLAHPGEAYFAKLLAVLEPSIGDEYPIFAYTYDSYLNYGGSGLGLAVRIAELQDQMEFRTIVLIGHSMGGLVSRSAVRHLENLGHSELVSGVITLGTPHLGTPYPSMFLAKVFTTVESPGGQSLRPENALSGEEEVPLFAYGGDISVRSQPPVGKYGILHDILCLKLGDIDCQSDGVVPLESAIPSFIALGTAEPVLPYTHRELYEGIRKEGNAEDEFYQSILSNIAALTPGEISVTVSGPSSVTGVITTGGDLRCGPTRQATATGNTGARALWETYVTVITSPIQFEFAPQTASWDSETRGRVSDIFVDEVQSHSTFFTYSPARPFSLEYRYSYTVEATGELKSARYSYTCNLP